MARKKKGVIDPFTLIAIVAILVIVIYGLNGYLDEKERDELQCPDGYVKVKVFENNQEKYKCVKAFEENSPLKFELGK